jgi:hypothetical protein
MAGLVTTDGTPVEGIEPLDSSGQDWAQVQAAQARSADAKPAGEMPAPPRKDPQAPFGRTKDGTPKKAPGGRPPKARVEQPTAKTAPGEVKDYTQSLAELTEGAWFLMAQFPVTQPQAAILKAHRPNLVSGWNLAAQNNRMIASGVEMLTGKGTWVAAVAMASAPFVMQSLAIWTRSDEQLAAAGMPTKEELAQSTHNDLQELVQAQEAALREATGTAQAA